MRQKYRQTIADTLLPHLISQVFNLYFFSVTHPDVPEAIRRTFDFSLEVLRQKNDRQTIAIADTFLPHL